MDGYGGYAGGYPPGPGAGPGPYSERPPSQNNVQGAGPHAGK